MLRLWVLAVWGLIAVLGLACSDEAEDVPSTTPASSGTAASSSGPSSTPIKTVAASSTPGATELPWKTYSDTPDGLSVDYPSNWFFVPPGGSEGYALLILNYDPNLPRPENGIAVTIDSFVDGRTASEFRADSLARDACNTTVLSSKMVTVGDLEGIQEDLEFLGNKGGTAGADCPTTPVATRFVTGNNKNRIISIHILPALAGDEEPVTTVLKSLRLASR